MSVRLSVRTLREGNQIIGYHCLFVALRATLWVFSTSVVWLAVGAFLMQVMVQGAWGVIPVHLNELSPDDARGTFPGFVYQLGNLIASVNATLQAGIAVRYGGNYAIALAAVAGTVAVVIMILTALGTEAKGVVFGTTRLRGRLDTKGLQEEIHVPNGGRHPG